MALVAGRFEDPVAVEGTEPAGGRKTFVRWEVRVVGADPVALFLLLLLLAMPDWRVLLRLEVGLGLSGAVPDGPSDGISFASAASAA